MKKRSREEARLYKAKNYRDRKSTKRCTSCGRKRDNESLTCTACKKRKHARESWLYHFKKDFR